MDKDFIVALADLKEEEVLSMVNEKIQAGEDPHKILELCREVMVIVGQRFQDEEYFLPELIMAGEIVKDVMEIVLPKIQQDNVKLIGKVLIGTVAGDIHDIGKNIVIFMLEANGFKVLDIGVDIPPEKFVEKIKEFQPDVIGLSGLLTLAFDSMKETIDEIKKAGLRDEVKIMVGGSQVDEEVARYAGADAYGEDASVAVSLCKKWLGV